MSTRITKMNYMYMYTSIQLKRKHVRTCMMPPPPPSIQSLHDDMSHSLKNLPAPNTHTYCMQTRTKDGIVVIEP